jgi:large subunit ribosomal protein L25
MKLNAEIKTRTGKGINRRLRKDGRVPAILYGRHQDPIPLSLNSHEVEKVLAGGAGRKLVTLGVSGLSETPEETMVMFKDIERNALTGALTHVDLYSIRRGEKISIVLPLTFIGDAKEDEKGGTLQFASREISIECLPRNIPDHIEVDISGIEMGHSLVMGDIALPEDIKLIDGPAKVVASIVAVRAELEEEAEEDAEMEETESADDTREQTTDSSES